MTKITWHTEKMKLGDLKEWDKNPRQLTKHDYEHIGKSIETFGLADPLIVNKDGSLIGGHMRKRVMLGNGAKPDELVDVRVPDRQLNEEEAAELNIRLNKNSGDWDWDTMANNFDISDLLDWGFTERDLEIGGFDLDEEPPEDPGAEIDKADQLREKWQTELGQIWSIGQHKIACGDCTDAEVVARLMGGKKARLIFTDPPYGIGKEIINDDLKREDWVKFYRSFTKVMLDHLIENGYFYVWGYFETLSDYWQEIIKPRGDCNFRNFIIWKKTFIQGQKVEDFRQYPEHYTACLLGIYGMPFQNGPWSVSPNAEFYPEIFEPIRAYLDGERKKMGWDIPTVKAMVGHSDLSGDHWFGRSQWTMPTRVVYETLQENARNDAFRKEYDAFRKEYDAFRKEYDELRGHFDNSFGFTDIWEFDELTLTNLHPTVKPVEVCERGIMTNSKDSELVLDVFLGSGSTMVACQRLNRIGRGIEISPAYVAVSLQRLADMGLEPELIE